MAHIVAVVAYTPGELGDDPLLLFKIWKGISSFGGFLGALIAMLVWARLYKVRLLTLSDALLFGLVYGWFFGRIGCFTAHDHPGRETAFFLGVHYRDGVVRHDLGLYEAIFTGFLVLLFSLLGRNPGRRVGLYAAITTLLYGPVRFALDFLRVEGTPNADPRYFGLTPAQYGAIGVFIVGLVLTSRILRKPEFPKPVAEDQHSKQKAS
jgi:phosphatidylglycerol:prolipoprotein diacylglycerol transferase